MSKHEEMEQEAREAIIERLRDGYDGYYSELVHAVFNTDYYIIGTYLAEQALQEYGVFDAMRKVQEYEMFNFGEHYTNVTNPEELVNALYFIIGSDVLTEMMEDIDEWHDNWNNHANEETNAAILEQIE